MILGAYMYFDAQEAAVQGREAALVTADISQNQQENCLHFWYHLNY